MRDAKKTLSASLANGVKEILGTAQSVGCTIDGRPAHDIIEAIDSGDVEIPSEVSLPYSLSLFFRPATDAFRTCLRPATCSKRLSGFFLGWNRFPSLLCPKTADRGGHTIGERAETKRAGTRTEKRDSTAGRHDSWK